MSVYYISHPYTNDPAGNVEKARKYAEFVMKKHPTTIHELNTVINPLDNFQFAGTTFDYMTVICSCLELLKAADALVLCGDWQNSKGCCMEYAAALTDGKTIYEINSERDVYSMEILHYAREE